MSSKKKYAPKAPDQVIPEGGKATVDLSVNSHEDWQAIRKSWSETQVEKLQAKTEKFFVTDEELPLSRHINFGGDFCVVH